MSGAVLPGYRLERLVHRGRSFDVYDAWSLERACPVVVKRARPGAEAEASRRLVLEGERLHALAHPHLVRCYEVHCEPRASLVLETLPGLTLGAVFCERDRLPLPDVAQMGVQLASALLYLHRHGLVHADLKPGNAIVSGGGHLRLIDLSLAQAPGPWRSTRGTPGYLAPEQARSEDVGPWTDVWGLGLLLLEAAAGDDPYPEGCPEYDEERGPRASPRPLHLRRRGVRELGELVAAMTAIDPAARPALPDVAGRLRTWAVAG